MEQIYKETAKRLDLTMSELMDIVEQPLSEEERQQAKEKGLFGQEYGKGPVPRSKGKIDKFYEVRMGTSDGTGHLYTERLTKNKLFKKVNFLPKSEEFLENLPILRAAGREGRQIFLNPN